MHGAGVKERHLPDSGTTLHVTLRLPAAQLPTVVVLDTNVLQADWMMRGLAIRVLRFMSWHNYLTVVIPTVVLEEIVSNHDRQKRAAQTALAKLNRERHRDGLPVVREVADPVDYRTYINEFMDEVVSSWELAPYPAVQHEEIVKHSLSGSPPFDATDRGYRDFLVWETVRELAAQGRHVVFASNDGDFNNGTSGQLAANLEAQVEPLPGEVALAPSLSDWLLQNFPFQAVDMKEAANIARDIDIDDFLMQSDFLDTQSPHVDELDLPEVAHEANIETVDWIGPLTRVGIRKGPDGSVLAEYDMPVDVEVRANLTEEAAAVLGWRVLGYRDGRTVLAELLIHATARLVVFGGAHHEYVEEVFFRPTVSHDINQPGLFDIEGSGRPVV